MSEYLAAPIIDLHIGELSEVATASAVNALVYLLPLIAALVVSMAIIPVMVRLAPVLGMTPANAAFIFRDIEAKRRATRYLHAPPGLVAPVPGITD